MSLSQRKSLGLVIVALVVAGSACGGGAMPTETVESPAIPVQPTVIIASDTVTPEVAITASGITFDATPTPIPTQTLSPVEAATATEMRPPSATPSSTETTAATERPSPTNTLDPKTATAIQKTMNAASTSVAKTETAAARMTSTAIAKSQIEATRTARAATEFARLHPSPTPLPNFVPILGNIWSGVKVYYGSGSQKAYGFEILGGSESCPSMPSGRGLRVRDPNGKEEWKDRDYIIMSGLFYLIEGDPALEKIEWYEYSPCP